MAIVRRPGQESNNNDYGVINPRLAFEREVATSVHQFAQDRLNVQPWQAGTFCGCAYLSTLLKSSPGSRPLGLLLGIPVMGAMGWWGANFAVGSLARRRIEYIDSQALPLMSPVKPLPSVPVRRETVDASYVPTWGDEGSEPISTQSDSYLEQREGRR